MCRKVQCAKCKLFTWEGCGLHKDEVMAKIPMNERCICDQKQTTSESLDDQKIDSTVCTDRPIHSDPPTITPPTITPPIITNDIKMSLIETIEAHQDRVWCCSWNPIKPILATTSGDKTIKLWAKSSIDHKWKCIQHLDAHTRTVRCVAWNPTGNLFASASFDGSIGIWQNSATEGLLTSNSDHSVIEFECIDLLEGHDNEVKSLSWDCSGRLLASCSRDKSVWIWELEEEEDSGGDIEFEVVAVKRSHDGDVKCVRWHPLERLLISCSYDDTIKLYKCEDAEDDWFVNQILKSHKSTVWKVIFQPMNGDQFVSVSDDRSLVIWEKMGVHKGSDTESEMVNGMYNVDPLAYRLKQSVEELHEEAIYGVDWLCHRKDGINLIVTCSGDNAIKILRESKEKWAVVMEMEESHETDVNWVEWGPRIRPGVFMMASCSDDGSLKIWEMETGVDESRFKADDDFAFDPEYNDIVNEID